MRCNIIIIYTNTVLSGSLYFLHLGCTKHMMIAEDTMLHCTVRYPNMNPLQLIFLLMLSLQIHNIFIQAHFPTCYQWRFYTIHFYHSYSNCLGTHNG